MHYADAETVIDLTPKWWQRNMFIQRLRHWLAYCEGFAAQTGPDCPYCEQEVRLYIAETQRLLRLKKEQAKHEVPCL